MPELSVGQAVCAYLSSLVVFLVMDIGWITKVVSPMYKSQLGSIVLDRPSLPSAIAFYLLYMVGLVYFAVAPALRGNWPTAAVNGALYGFFAYITYSMTNLAVLKGWTGAVALSDIGWGTVVSAVTATGAYFVTRWVVG